MPRTATGPNGEKLVLEGNQWVPLKPNALPSAPTQEAAIQDSRIRQGMRTMGATLAANVASAPRVAGEILALGAALPRLVPGGGSFSDEVMAQKAQFPAAALMRWPNITPEQVLAASRTITDSFSNVNANAKRALALGHDPNADVGPMKSVTFGDTYESALADEQQRASDNPLSTSAGRTAGDVATMFWARPGRRATELLPKIFNPRADVSDVKGTLDSIARTLARGTGRTAEAGFDGAVMGALGDGNPAKTAAWSAGIQAGGSMAMAAKNSFFRNPLKSFATLYLGHEMWKAVAPGAQDLFDSKDTAVQEMVAAYGLGAAAAAVGSSRGIGTGNVRRFTDALSTASRAGVASVVTQLQEAAANKQDQYARVLKALSEDQQRFGTDARVLIERAANSDKPRALLDQIDELMRSSRFRKQLEDAEAEQQPSQGGSSLRPLGTGQGQPQVPSPL